MVPKVMPRMYPTVCWQLLRLLWSLALYFLWSRACFLANFFFLCLAHRRGRSWWEIVRGPALPRMCS